MSEQAEEDKSRIVEPAIAADAAEGVGLSWVSVEERLPDEEQGDLLIYNTKWVDSMAAEDVDENCRGWYWLPLSAIPLPGQSPDPSAGMREALEWYAEQARDCRKMGRDGDRARQALDADGGARALAALRADEEGGHG